MEEGRRERKKGRMRKGKKESKGKEVTGNSCSCDRKFPRSTHFHVYPCACTVAAMTRVLVKGAGDEAPTRMQAASDAPRRRSRRVVAAISALKTSGKIDAG